jgi:hypothetical protein
MGISVSNVDADECNKERRERLEEARFIFALCCCCCVGRSEVLVCSEGSRTPESCDRAGNPLAAKLKWQESRSEDSNHNGSRSAINAPTAKNVSWPQMLTSMFQVCFCTMPYQPLPSLPAKSKHRFDSKQGRGSGRRVHCHPEQHQSNFLLLAQGRHTLD